jgi:hypothetical protein
MSPGSDVNRNFGPISYEHATLINNNNGQCRKGVTAGHRSDRDYIATSILQEWNIPQGCVLINEYLMYIMSTGFKEHSVGTYTCPSSTL